MTLGSAAVVAFLATTDPESARRSYKDVLGLRFLVERSPERPWSLQSETLTPFGSRFSRITHPAYTVLGWRVEDIETASSELAENGVVFEFFDMLDQDGAGISTFPNGDRVTWFKDPSGNMPSITQSHCSRASR